VQETIRLATARADIVILDTPPLFALADALALSGSLDALVLVARLRSLRRPMVSELRRKLDEFPVRKIGFALTFADADDTYSYLPSYGYYLASYGQGRKKQEKEPIA
jgi:succinoglycan biosynthesis transport protein ExoP